MGKNNTSLWDILFGASKPKNNIDKQDDWTERCDECGVYSEDCECDCDDEDCHNEDGW